MKNEYEIIRHTKLKHIHAFVNNITYRNFHMHSDFELLLVLQGMGRIKVKNDIFAVKEKDALLINPNEIHEFEAVEDSMKLIIIQFSRHFCNDYYPFLRNTCFKTKKIKECFSDNDYHKLLKLMTTFTDTYIRADAFFAFSCVSLLLQTLALCYQNMEYIIMEENEYREHKRKKDRMNRISSYIDENYLYPIRLKDIAEMENLSVTHVSHFFTDNFGVTFQEYLNSIRLEHALQLAGDKNLSLSAISEMSGFSDPKYLHKAFFNRFSCPFREYGVPAHAVAQKEPKADPGALQQLCSDGESLALIASFSEKYI